MGWTSFHFDGVIDATKVNPANLAFRKELQARLEVFRDKRSCYFPIAVEPITFLEQKTVLYTVLYTLSIHCSLKNYNNEIQDFINWIMPYVENGGDKNAILCLGYFQPDGKMPEFIFWQDKTNQGDQ
jgi:hypothetical protein